MPSELDELMDRDPESLSDRDLDGIILYHRKRRAEKQALPPGTRGKRATKDIGEKVSLAGFAERITQKAAAPAIIKRRI